MGIYLLFLFWREFAFLFAQFNLYNPLNKLSRKTVLDKDENDRG